MTEIRFICPDCEHELERDGGGLRCAQGHTFAATSDGILDLLPHVVPDSLRSEAAYHGSLAGEWIALNQLDAPRNQFYHQAIIDFIAARATEASNVLEIGGGPGFDLRSFLASGTPFEHYVFSETSVGLTAHALRESAQVAAARGVRAKVIFCTIEVEHIPLASAQFDFAFLIAVLHRVPHPEQALSELARVTAPGGHVLLGIEPNRFWAKATAVAGRLVRRVLLTRPHSQVDEAGNGFTVAQLEEIGSRCGLSLVGLSPVWLICGFVHHGLELLYRLLRLKRRIVLPPQLEQAIVRLDEALLRFPGTRRLAWHYTAMFRKWRRD